MNEILKNLIEGATIRRLKRRKEANKVIDRLYYYNGFQSDLVSPKGDRLKPEQIMTSGALRKGSLVSATAGFVDGIPSVNPKKEEKRKRVAGKVEKYFGYFLMTETPNPYGQNPITKVILGGVGMPVTLTTVPYYINACSDGDDDGSGDPLRASKVCKRYTDKTEWIFIARTGTSQGQDSYSYFKFVTIGLTCLPRIRSASSGTVKTGAGSIVTDTIGKIVIESAGVSFMSESDLLRPDTGQLAITNSPVVIFAQGGMWNGSSISFQPGATGDFYPTSGALRFGDQSFGIISPVTYTGDGESFGAYMVSGNPFFISVTQDGKPVKEGDFNVEPSPPSKPQKRRNEISTAVTTKKGLTYINIAHTPVCDTELGTSGNYYLTSRTWIVDSKGRFRDYDGTILGTNEDFQSSRPPSVSLFLTQQDFLALFRNELINNDRPAVVAQSIELADLSSCNEQNIDNLSWTQEEPEATGGILATISKGVSHPSWNRVDSDKDNIDFEALYPFTRIGPGFTANQFSFSRESDIRFDDPSRELLKDEFSVSVLVFDMVSYPNSCSKIIKERTLIKLRGLNRVSDLNYFPRDNTPWPHDGWGFHWLVVGKTKE